MLRSRLVTAALAAVAFAPVGNAWSTVSEPGPGEPCAFVSVTDEDSADDTQTAEVDGGPLALVGDDGLPGSGTLVCTIRVDSNSHSGPVAAAASAHGIGVVVLAPTFVQFTATATQALYLCASYVDDDGGSLYWVHTGGDFDGGYWSADPDAECYGAIEPPSPLPVVELLDATVCPVLLAVDARLDTELAVLWQGCEPYSPII
jgi:hypothetical protein